MPTPDGRIGSRDICTGAAVERVIADGGVTSLKISATLQSDNYSAGSAGWQINRATGSAEFQDVVVRGTLNASDITSGTLSVARIGSNSITMGKIELQAALVTNQYLQSSSYAAGSSGWRINANGTAEFQDVTVRGSINADDIDGGTLTADYLGAGTIGAEAILLTNSASSYIASANGTDWYIRGDGVASFTDVYISGTLASNTVTGWLTTTGSGGFRTGSTGTYIEIGTGASEGADSIVFNDSGSASPGYIYGSGAAIGLVPPGDSTGTVNQMTLYRDSTISAASIHTNKAGAALRLTTDNSTSRGLLEILNSSSQYVFEVRHEGAWNCWTNGSTVVSKSYYSGGNGYLETDVVIASNEVQAGDGTYTDPSFTFEDDGDTGMYRYGNNSLGFTLGSAVGMVIASNKRVSVYGDGISYQGTNGSGSANSIGFKWSSPYIYGRVDNAVEAVVGTVSDPRLKTGIRPMANPLGRLLALDPIEFYPTDLDGTVDYSQLHGGIDASKVKPLEPWLVTGEDSAFLSLNYMGMVSMLLGAIKELSERLDTLEAAA